MSNKISYYYTDKLHFYQEAGDEKSIYVEIIEGNINLKIEIPLKQFLQMIRCVDFESLKKQTEITDKKIKDHVTKTVEDRMQSNYGIKHFMGFGIYGDSKLEKDEQIANGINYFTEKREELKKYFQNVQSMQNRLFFGLENILDS